MQQPLRDRDLDDESRVQLDSKTAESASNCVQNRAFYRSVLGVEASKANCINSVRSDSPFTKRSGDMVYNSWLD